MGDHGQKDPTYAGCRSFCEKQNNTLQTYYINFQINYPLALEKSRTQNQNSASNNPYQVSLLK
jgi:hypothetical protein